MAHISDADLFERMTRIEGARWAAQQRAQPEAPYGLLRKLALWEAFQLSEERQHPEASWADLLESSDERVVYGEGGYHRYVVRDNGDVCFSQMHAREPARQLAQELGFKPC